MSEPEATWNPRRALILGFGALAVLIFGVGAWSALASISGAVISSGQIEVEGNRQAIQHPDGGVVGEILVEDGDIVQAGDIVLRFDDVLIRTEAAIIESQLFEILARKARLTAERDGTDELQFDEELVAIGAERDDIRDLMDGQWRLFEARRDNQQQQISQLRERKIQIERQIDGTLAQIASMTEQRDFVTAELDDEKRMLQQGLTQQRQVMGLERENARMAGVLGELEARIAQLRAQISEAEIEILRLNAGIREEAITALRELDYREIELRERRLSMQETLSRLEVRSPANGIVYGRTVNTPRQVIRPADVLMYVVPQETPLVISARIETIHVDQVNIGQTATLRFPAFDQRFTPEITGMVTKVSADAFTDENTGVPYYSAELLPLEGESAKLGNLQLLPGMPVEAFIKTGDRTPLNYLVKPLSDYFTKAFREN
ncbi:MAG: HlyD family type I secretion periplasmic adaptor subunit [Pseudomonadota bacterium]